MQDVALGASEELAGPNGDDVVLDRDGRQVEMMPAALPEEMPGNVILMQALHDHDDGTVLLVVEARHQGAGDQSITRRRASSDIASSALSGSSTMMRSAPRPVRVPPTEMA